MKIFSPLTFVTLAASLRGVGAASSCLQPGADNYKCDSGGHTLYLQGCDIDDSDLSNGSLKACLSTFGRANIRSLRLNDNSLTTLPRNFFNGLGATNLVTLSDNKLTRLRTRIFDRLQAVKYLSLDGNKLETLPNGVFDELGSLKVLSLHDNELTTLRDGVFDELGSLTVLKLNGNKLTSVADDLFDGTVSLKHLDLRDNDLECKPRVSSTISTVKLDSGHFCDRCPTYGGIRNYDDAGDTCCPKSCGACVDEMCHTRPGGRSNCCPSRIRAEGPACNWSNPAPCRPLL